MSESEGQATKMQPESEMAEDVVQTAADTVVDEEGVAADDEQVPVAELLEDAKRSFALRKWSEAADSYGQALDALRGEYPEDAPQLAPLHHRYGHALLEYAIATSGALGGGGNKDAPLPSRPGASTVAAARAQDGNKEKSVGEGSSSKANNVADKANDPRFTFGGDAEESDNEEDEGPQQAGDGDDEDDLGDAFSVLELARVRYEKLLEEGQTLTTLDSEVWDTLMIKSQLAEVLNDLADVGLESENFQQASSDYESAVELLEPLLQPHSRRLADAYLRLGLALEFHPDAAMQASAEKYVSSACVVLRKRLDALEKRQNTLHRERSGGEAGLAQAEEAANEVRVEKANAESAARLEEEGVLAPKPGGQESSTGALSNGKGKAVAAQEGLTLEKDDVAGMDWQMLRKELNDVKEMSQELELKLEEYANQPPGTGSAPGGVDEGALASGDTKAALQQAINEALLGGSTNAIAGGSGAGVFGARAADPNAPVNDLSAMVKKKKKVQQEPETESDTNGKRKAAELQTSAPIVEATKSNGEADKSKRARVEDA